jgi:hypothetical protein
MTAIAVQLHEATLEGKRSEARRRDVEEDR